MPVKDAQQNKHSWWGTLTLDQNTEVVGGILLPDSECVFVKTSREAHYVTHGTYVTKVRVISLVGDKAMAENAIREKTKDQVNSLINLPSGRPIVEILEIDNVKTSPLVREFNKLTEELFQNEEWLNRNSVEVGADDIRVGREMPTLPTANSFSA